MKPRNIVLLSILVGCSAGSGSPAGGSGDTSAGGAAGSSGGLPSSGSATGSGLGGGSGAVGGSGSLGGSGIGGGSGAVGASGMTGSGAVGASGMASTGAAAGSGTAESGTLAGSGASAGGGSAPSVPQSSLTAPKMRSQHNFTTTDADPSEAMSTCGACGTQPEQAAVNPKSPTMMWKLVISLQGAGGTAGSLGGTGGFCVARGFHVFGVAYDAYAAVIPAPNPAWYGDVRREEFDGMDHTGGKMGLKPQDGVATRVQMGLKYLQAKFPTEAWGYYLAADGSVRWQDVIFTGFSHGASSAARYAYLVNSAGSVSCAGPRDNMCNTLACNGGEIVASWFTETPATPITKFFGFTGAQDAQHTQHLFAFEKMMIPGTPQELDGSKPPYTTHRFTSASAPHEDFCGNAAYQAACNYAFGVPTENQAGVN